MQERKAVGVYITDGEGRFLLTQRGTAARHEPYTWEGTGGEVEQGETFEDAARREALEEIGVTITDLVEILDATNVADKDGTEWHTKIYTARTSQLPRIDTSGSCAGFGWFKPEEIEGLKMPSYAKKDIDALIKVA